MTVHENHFEDGETGSVVFSQASVLSNSKPYDLHVPAGDVYVNRAEIQPIAVKFDKLPKKRLDFIAVKYHSDFDVVVSLTPEARFQITHGDTVWTLEQSVETGVWYRFEQNVYGFDLDAIVSFRYGKLNNSDEAATYWIDDWPDNDETSIPIGPYRE